MDYQQLSCLTVTHKYMSERFKREFDNSNIMLKTSSPDHHQTNGVVERTIETLKALLKKANRKRSACTQHYGSIEPPPKNNDMPS